MRLHLLRHPKPDLEAGICYGQKDVPAWPSVELLEQLRQRLPTAAPVWSSPLQRCAYLAKHLHPAPQFDPDLMEIHFGAWEGKPWSEVPRGELDAWAADIEAYVPPGGESVAMLCRRVRRALDRVLQSAAEDVIWVTHAGVMRAVASLLGSGGAGNVWDLNVEFGTVWTVKMDR